MRPTIITDIDGTLNALGNMRALLTLSSSQYLGSAIKQLNLLCAETNGKVALISARLRVRDPSRIVKEMRACGFEGEFFPLQAVPRSQTWFTRGRDLEEFMGAHAISYPETIILDNSSVGYSALQRERLISPVSTIGLSESDCANALELLERHAKKLHPSCLSWVNKTTPNNPSAIHR